MANSSKRDRKEQRSGECVHSQEGVSAERVKTRPQKEGKRWTRAMIFSLKHWTATKSSAQGWVADELVEGLPSMHDTLGSLPSIA